MLGGGDGEGGSGAGGVGGAGGGDGGGGGGGGGDGVGEGEGGGGEGASQTASGHASPAHTLGTWLSKLKWIAALAHSLSFMVFVNMFFMLVTLATFHLLMSWLNWTAPQNRPSMLVTCPTFHPLMSSLNKNPHGELNK